MYVIPFLSVNVQSCIFSYQTCFIEERGWFKRASGVMKINDSGIATVSFLLLATPVAFGKL